MYFFSNLLQRMAKNSTSSSPLLSVITWCCCCFPAASGSRKNKRDVFLQMQQISLITCSAHRVFADALQFFHQRSSPGFNLNLSASLSFFPIASSALLPYFYHFVLFPFLRSILCRALLKSLFFPYQRSGKGQKGKDQIEQI
jgi:hypothetical protein